LIHPELRPSRRRARGQEAPKKWAADAVFSPQDSAEVRRSLCSVARSMELRNSGYRVGFAPLSGLLKTSSGMVSGES